jgi:hypothetical protein
MQLKGELKGRKFVTKPLMYLWMCEIFPGDK